MFTMKKLILFLPVLLSVTFLFAQSTVVHDSHAEARTVTSFHAIEISSGINLTIKQGNDEAVAVSALTPEIRSRIKTKVENGTLKIYFDNDGLRGWKNNRELKAYVSFKNIDGLEINSGSFTTIDGELNATNLNVNVSSGAGFEGIVKATKLDVDQSSGSRANLKGKVTDLKVSASSGAGFSGYELTSDNCKADASSGGNIEVNVTKELDAQASSGGGIDYKGSVSVTNISKSSGGRVAKHS